MGCRELLGDEPSGRGRAAPGGSGPDRVDGGAGEPCERKRHFPARLRDSVSIVRATLELTPVVPIEGLPTDPLHLQARAVVADLGAKSPVNATPAADTIEAGTTGTTAIEVIRLVQLWTATTSGPTALVLSVAPEQESASFSRPVFYSTRAADPAVRPRLRLNYTLKFPFENP